MAWKQTSHPTVQRQRDKWVVRVDGIDTVSGARRPRQLGTYRSRRSARAAASAYAASGESGAERNTVGATVDRWVAGKVDVSNTSRLQYEWAAGHIKAGDVGPSSGRRYLSTWACRQIPLERAPVGQRSRRQARPLVPRDALARYPEHMAGDERPTLEELSQLSPNERAELARAGVVREWEQLDASEQAHIQAKTAELRRRRADAQT